MSINTRKLHRLLGLLLLLPLFGWALTGAVFFIKPGYQGAYEQLAVKARPLADGMEIRPEPHWRQVRLVGTVLGAHLLVTTEGPPLHLQPGSQQPLPLPDEAGLWRLLQDAISVNPTRYGDIVALEGARARTSTGVSLHLDWNTLTLRQQGWDTRLINGLYRVHYLQWLPSAGANRMLGLAGLALLLAMALVGFRLCFRKRS
ncbi:PepSY domain-containing protein [Zobellella iuensis]|uniref:PepSY domain-containing protein n=1 Tax=Zobellella iuensis TaxID=2803811 RepID=A0ABS1QS69_9GAMM|nr:PepSY domain-containing protein [Zobellella iuensis]MBL1377387.1 PepSY domain-containing protein [Zobellella iuensis]